MRIQWESLERIRDFVVRATHLDRETGAFVSTELDEIMGEPGLYSEEPGRYFELHHGEALPNILAGSRQRSILFGIEEPGLRAAALAALRDVERAPVIVDREERRADRKRRNAVLDALLSRRPDVAERWERRHELDALGGIWHCLVWEKVEVENPPPGSTS